MIKKESEKVLVRAPGLMAQPTSGSGQTMSDTAKEFSSPEKAQSMMAILKPTSAKGWGNLSAPMAMNIMAIGKMAKSKAMAK